MTKKYERRRWRFDWFDMLNNGVMLLIIIIMVFPIYYCVAVSISDGSAVMQGRVMFYPIGFSLKSYQAVLQNPQIIQSYANTLQYTVVGTCINLIMSTLCAYPLSRPQLKGRRVINSLILFTMLFSGGMIPTYLQVKALGLYNSMWAIVLPSAINTWNMFIMRTFFSSLPEEMHESAHIDGASTYQVLFYIVLPLSKSIMATMLMFYAVGHWNSYLSSLLYLSEYRKFPLQMIMRSMLIESHNTASLTSVGSGDMVVTDSTIKYSLIIVSILPILCVYPILQRYFVKGVMVGSVKG